MPLTASQPFNTARRVILHPRLASFFKRWPGYIAISIAGSAGFFGLLLAAHFLPQWGQGLRIAALIWFAWFGVLRLAATRRAGPRPASAEPLEIALDDPLIEVGKGQDFRHRRPLVHHVHGGSHEAELDHRTEGADKAGV